MADASWPVLAAGLAGTVLGSVLQWAQGTVQARRERRREELSWSREDRRLWAEKRQSIYLDTIAVARRQIMSLEEGSDRWQLLGREIPAVAATSHGQWQRTPEVLADWNHRLAEVEFYGSDDVRSAIAKLDATFDALEKIPSSTEAASIMTAYAEDTYAECVSLMRRDLGLSDGGRVDLGESRAEVVDHLAFALNYPRLADEAPDRPEGPPKDPAD